ncbi:sigma-70 family RNA polymerase sigma factor [Candidatus Korobacter versatilis]|nr:sigma-70 family RNA polymerase sigma factor [Candidatus Koribacter versatilis]
MHTITRDENHRSRYRGCRNADNSGVEGRQDSRVKRYASCVEFQQVFLKNLDSIFQLCVLLMGNDQNAEQYLLDAFDDCVLAQQVFRDWALAWAKHTVIENAIRTLKSRPKNAELLRVPEQPSIEDSDTVEAPQANALAIMALRDFERIVLVMSVFERYSDRHCALLLGCSVERIRAARTRALVQLSSSPESESAISVDRTKDADLTQAGPPLFTSVERL